jgi:hypothetical protein
MKGDGLRIAASLLLFMATVAANGADLVVTLSPPQQAIARGAQPRFSIAVSPTGAAQRVMRFGERTDLRHNYAQLIITQNGTRAEVPRFISDPGPVTERDYALLNPGDNMTFDHDGLPYDLRGLSPGIYSAVVRLRADWDSGLLCRTRFRSQLSRDA